MDINVIGLVSLIVFYLLILAVGVGAAWYKKKRVGNEKSETNMVAGRDISLFLGCFTMTGKIVFFAIDFRRKQKEKYIQNTVVY